ncbi:endogenous retrovirus group S71 member 1 Env polyprotein-like [Trachypithecus francoisi]|uniref:endogenous retrovirus group S71 member 1 Env polyprotein-like n=1 Tax=Trachypithecus francoisi TaxID=54180 RepID=UPI00141B0CD1|nr:endogenous retrovirus group S71 member 1 Env polyprotein-like [Trachypithecus francoisi]
MDLSAEHDLKVASEENQEILERSENKQPQVYVHNGSEGQLLIAPPELHPRFCQVAPLLVPLVAGLSIAGSAAIGTTALIQGETGLMSPSQQVDDDLSHLQSAIKILHAQVESLAEAVLQNRQGLDLLFLSQGGLCAALGESCCFYANQSEVIKNTLQKVRENLGKCQQEQESNTPWYQSMFNWNPWLTNYWVGRSPSPLVKVSLRALSIKLVA